ncbi:DNA-directed RNA polymerases I, II, and III subunit rpabc4 [Tetrabaena socialis]|uniref:DNA-directed RNA polymerases I, II, and III subunit rpabc4 n=1 Tax=Tetrabaena socialis TaxID=47790 RepID=A0A2J7ZT82_9CHLO|nr:DNA-directed RNA polymerases I, II, and III subunit rpabc4 [Tetrabaena socialis]|eukprot:PNH03472.1 DNA-directed RNA polymerases I, II, and III subunit rpabc4 [Tetrabaena socialis]
MSGAYGGAMPATVTSGVPYICGQCGSEISLKPGDIIQCRECGYRILYKKRTNKVVQFEAR